MPNTSYGTLMRNGVNYSHDSAESISYDNTSSGLTSTNTQDAINEIKNNIPTTLSQLSEDTTHRVVTDTEKTTWNNKSDLTLGTTSSTAAAGNHTHNITIAADSGTSTLSMAANTKYKLTAGGKSVIFTTPPDNGSTYTGTGLISIDSNNVISTTAEVNQNAFSNIKIGSTTVAADTKTDTVEYAASGILTITGDATNDKVTFGVSTGTTSATAAAGNHTHSAATTAAAGFMAAADKTKLNGIATGAEVNQNAFSNILIGSTTVAADTKTDTVEYAASGILTITGDATNDKITFGVATGTTSATAAAGNHSHSAATTAAAGFMAAADKTKLNGIATGAEVNQNAFSNIVVGSTTVAADAKTDSVTYAASGILTITGDATNDKVTFGVSTGTTSATAAAGNHTHGDTTIAADSGTSSLTMAANTKYKITAAGKSYIFTTPPDTNTKVTSAANHYAPTSASGEDISASASGATAAWSIDVVQGVTLNTDGKGHVTGMTVTSGKIPANPNTDTKVKINNTNPTTATWYYPTWYTGTSGTGEINANDGLRYYTLQGTSAAAGRALLSVGNATQTGTAGNKYGEVWIYSQKQGYVVLKATAASTASRAITFPDKAGTVALTTDITSGIEALDATITGMSASKTLSALSETDGVISASFQNISITKSQISDFPTIPDAVAVKGNAESSYRTGNVNLTPANIGALALSGGTLTGNVRIARVGTTANVDSYLYLGNNTAAASGGSRGVIQIFGSNTYRTNIFIKNDLSGNKELLIPDLSGTIAVTSELDWSGPELVTSTAIATIPACREILIMADIANATYSGLFVTIHIPYAFLTTTARDFRGGWSQASSYGGAIYFVIQKNSNGTVTIALSKGYLNNTETTQYCSGNVFYR